jgi:RNA polymerase sigma-70 factor (subfamily 1)
MEHDALDPLAQTAEQVRAAKEGSPSALDELFTRYLPEVRAIVAARMGKRLRELADQEDLVQESMRAAIAGLERFEHRSEGSFRHWLAVCVENAVRQEARRLNARKRGAGRVQRLADLEQTRLAESLFQAVGPSVSQQARAHETEERIEQALLELAPRYREVIVLRVHGELSYLEIAEAMQLPSDDTANTLFLRARQKLRRLLSR